jgi:hypothetical protein
MCRLQNGALKAFLWLAAEALSADKREYKNHSVVAMSR